MNYVGTGSPGAARTVRALASGTLPGRMHTFAGVDPVRYAPTPSGDATLLVADDSAAGALLRHPDWREIPLALEIPDGAPGSPGAPARGTGWLVGWARPLSRVAQRCAAVDLVGRFPAADLLDVGHCRALVRLRVSEVWLDTARGRATVELAAYRAAAADLRQR